MGTTAGQSKNRPDDDPDEDQDPDRIQSLVADHAEENAKGGKQAAEQQRQDRGQPDGSEQVIGRKRSNDVEEHNRRQGLQTTPIRGRGRGVNLLYRHAADATARARADLTTARRERQPPEQPCVSGPPPRMATGDSRGLSAQTSARNVIPGRGVNSSDR